MGTTTTTTTEYIIPGVLISGGSGSSAELKVELHNLINNTRCSIVDLPSKRYGHTSVGGVVCGGGASVTSCIDMSGGSWSSAKFQSIRSRSYAVTWNFNPGKSFMILGGRSGNSGTTEIVYTNGTVEPGFDLQYDSYYACGIEDEDSYYITGGGPGYSIRVTRYFMDGSYQDMPNLNTGRHHHACGYFMNSNQEKVLLVVAGIGSSGNLASTEILVSGSQSWRTIQATYPASSNGIFGLRAISYSNKVIAYGGYVSSQIRNFYQFDANTETWTRLGSMLVSRHYHSVDMVNWSVFSKNCT